MGFPFNSAPPSSGGVTVGAPIASGIANAILFGDASGNLAQDAGFTFDAVTFSASILNLTGNASLTVEGDEGNAFVSVYATATGSTDSQIDLQCASDGDSYVFLLAGNPNFSSAIGVDASAGAFVLSIASTLGTANVFTADGTTFEVVDNFLTTSGSSITRLATAGSGSTASVQHTDNTNAASHATLSMISGGASGGDARALWSIGVGTMYVAGIDNDDSDKFKLSLGSVLGTTDVFTADGTTLEIIDVLKLNNTLQADVAAVSTHTVNINVGGTDYKFLVKT